MSIGRCTYGDLVVLRAPGATDDMLKIGTFCSLAKGSRVLLGGEHHTEWVSTYPFRSFSEWGWTPESAAQMATSRGSVEIGHDVWVGADALILSGSVIGDGAVIGACSVVSGTVAPYSVVTGNPARFARWRFDEPTRKALLKIRWWEWPDDRIKKAIPLLLSADVERFIYLVDRGEL